MKSCDLWFYGCGLRNEKTKRRNYGGNSDCRDRRD
uniref:Uncharacterized protein n=1 Tax=Manihot esculenta TaxID=3983 RepID=A0A2C9VGV4_MANES